MLPDPRIKFHGLIVYPPPQPPTSVPLSTPRPCSTFLPSLPSRRSTANTACASPKSTTPRRWRGRGECGVPSVPVRGRAEGASRSPCASATGPCEQPFPLLSRMLTGACLRLSGQRSVFRRSNLACRHLTLRVFNAVWWMALTNMEVFLDCSNRSFIS